MHISLSTAPSSLWKQCAFKHMQLIKHSINRLYIQNADCRSNHKNGDLHKPVRLCNWSSHTIAMQCATKFMHKKIAMCYSRSRKTNPSHSPPTATHIANTCKRIRKLQTLSTFIFCCMVCSTCQERHIGKKVNTKAYSWHRVHDVCIIVRVK